jgi:spermidine synthase
MFVVALAAFPLTAPWVLLQESWWYPDPIVYATTGRQRHVVTRGLGGFELFSDHQLIASELDGYRHVQALVRPAVARSAKPLDVLVLEGATGNVAREILRSSEVSRLTLVATDAALLRLGRRLDWLAEPDHPLDDPRVTTHEAEPIVWLERDSSTYDLIVADLPAPTGYREGKYYTEHFFRRVAPRLRPDGALSIPATSAERTPAAHACVVAAARRARLHVERFHTGIPTLGEWSYLLVTRMTRGGSTAPGTAPARPGGGLVNWTFHDTPDRQVVADVAACTLHDQRAVEAVQRSMRTE